MEMKKILSLLFAMTAATVTFSSCEDFLTKEPTNKISADTYFTSETDLKMFTDGMLVDYLPGFTTVAIGDDAYTDLCATKSGTDFLHPGLWNAEKQGGWSTGNFSFIRKCNYMLENMTRAKGKVSDETYYHYRGVAHFWRAYAHYIKMQTFGNVPWIDHVAQPSDSALLFAPRDDREFVFHNILADLDSASNSCLGTSKYLTSGRTYINKWVVLAMKAKMCLFEASYRKYHSVNPSTNEAWNNKYETSEDLYKEAADAALQIMESGKFFLHSGNAASAYSELFQSENIPTDEVIWSRQANTEASVTHDVTWYYNSATYGQKYSPTKELVDMYLKLDGNPITSDAVSPAEEFDGRDMRLSQTILGPGHTYVNAAGATEFKAPDFSVSLTGYAFVKWNIENAINYSKSLSNNSVPILRYAEVLLIYAEAKAELGEMTEDIWNKTIGAIRARAGVASIYPESASYQKDTFLEAYYKGAGVGGADLSDMILEIRRERATELAMEWGNRADDLARWGLGSYSAKRYDNKGWRGIYLTAADVKNGFEINGTKFKIGSTSSTSYKVANTGADATWSLTEGDHGYLVYNYKLEWDDKMYTRPIPVTAITLNKNLLPQNYGW